MLSSNGTEMARCMIGNLHCGREPVSLCKLCTNLSKAALTVFALQLEREPMNKAS